MMEGVFFLASAFLFYTFIGYPVLTLFGCWSFVLLKLCTISVRIFRKSQYCLILQRIELCAPRDQCKLDGEAIFANGSLPYVHRVAPFTLKSIPNADHLPATVSHPVEVGRSPLKICPA